MQAPIDIRTIVVRVAALALLLLLILVAVLTTRSLNRLPNTLLYFVQSSETSFRLEAAPRQLPRAQPEAHLRHTLQALIEGPTEAETARGLSSAIPETTTILELRLRDAIVEVDVSEDFASGGGSASMQGRLNQLFYSLTQPSYADGVSLFIEGSPLTYFGGEGLIVDNPWRRGETTTLPSW